VSHAAPAGGVPGNCSNTLGFRLACSATANKTFSPGALVMRFEPVTWYVGYNGSATNDRSPFSLYRISVRGNGTGNMVAQPVVEEIVEGVSDLQIRYITYAGEYVLATQTGLDWKQVSGVEIVLTIESPENRTSTSSTVPRVTRTLTHVVNLRNRV
jgi:type IV pilus assembly protein PilW